MKRILRAIAGLTIASTLLIAAPVFTGTASAEPFDAAKRGEIEAIVKNYLLSNPEIVRDAFMELDRRQKATENQARVAVIEKNNDLLLNSTRQAVLGNPNGDVTMVEFFDFNCPYCKRAMADMDRLIKDDPNLRVVLKEWPVLGQGSVEAHQIAIALNIIAPQSYYEFHEILLGGKGKANAASAFAAAEKVGVDRKALDEALKDPEIRATIEEVYMLADSLGMSGTPSYVIGQEVVFGAAGYDVLKSKIKIARDCTTATC